MQLSGSDRNPRLVVKSGYIAAGAVLAFSSFPIKMIPIDERLIREASEISTETGVGYGSIHAAPMRYAGLETVITEDTAHWKRIKGIRIIRPIEYGDAKDKIPSSR